MLTWGERTSQPASTAQRRHEHLAVSEIVTLDSSKEDSCSQASVTTLDSHQPLTGEIRHRFLFEK